MKLPPDRHLDNRWNACLDALTKAWNELGPDATLAALSCLTGDEGDAGDEPGDAERAATEEGAA